MNQLKTTNRDESQCENVEQLMDQSIASYSLRNQPTISYTVNSNLGENTNDSDSDNTVFDDYIQDLDQSEDDNCMDQMYIKSEIVINSEDNDNCNELLETEMKSLGSKNKTKFNKTDRKKTKTSIKKKLPKKTVKCRNCLSDGIDECRHQYRCRINGCNKLFESAKECNDHTESIHSETIRFRCDVDPCRQTFVLKVNYDRHIRDDHQREPKYNEFVKEIIDVSGDKKYQCHWDGCERLPYKHRESCVHHICDQHLLPPRDYRCDWLGCGKVYKTNHDLRYHQTEHENKSYQCQQCPAIFASEQRLKRHIERHGSTYQCKHINCQFQSGNLGKYNRHLLNVHNKTNQQLRCDIDECTKIYHIAGDLNRHQLLRHPDHYPDIPWKSCTQSNCTFQSKCNSYLTQHIKNHSRIFECTIGGCDKLFTTSYNLNQHYRMVHPDYMPDQPWLKCPVDGCKYTSKSDKNLSIHSKTHTKPFKCDICDKRFAARNRLKDHQSEHNGTVKRYRCEWPGCSATLKEKDKLKYHMERHTRDKTYRCEWPGCERTYNLKGSLRVQVDRDHRGIGGYRCQWPGCDYKSTNTIRWKNHLKIHDG
ncbi:zinc finger protein 658B-like [Oppia nitens]|uniref:zinc finger protein 658B-like n=1 Tax=Oppia nitens TaxID=1686743 RepID=UPI0023DA96CD|nr:zinc finger protein 658B-like [Oppia nitens]